MEITGPTLIDLKIRTESNYEDVATAISGRSAGYFIGSALGGVLVDKLGLFCDLMIAICLDGGAIATMGVPWVPNTELIWFLCCLQGTFEGVINIGKLILCSDSVYIYTHIRTKVKPDFPLTFYVNFVFRDI